MGVWVPKLTQFQGDYALFPMTNSALRNSITRLLCKNGSIPDIEREYQYERELLQSNQGVPFAAPLRLIIDFHRELENLRNQHQTDLGHPKN
jgi:hypothetical protein